MRTSALWALLLLAGVSFVHAQDAVPVAHWGFDRVDAGKTPDAVSGTEDAVGGNHRLVEGVKGQAIVLDGNPATVTARPL